MKPLKLSLNKLEFKFAAAIYKVYHFGHVILCEMSFFFKNVNNAMNFLLYLRTTIKMMCEDRKLNIHYLIDAQKFYITVSLHPDFLLPPQPSPFLIIFPVLAESTLYPGEIDTKIMKSQIFTD